MAGRLVNHIAGQSAGGRIGRSERGALHTAILFLQQVRVVVPEAYFQGELPGYFPVVLGEKSERVVAQPAVRDRGNIEAVDRSQQKTGVRESRGKDAETGGANLPGIGCLVPGECIPAVGTRVTLLRETLEGHFASPFECVI